MKDVPRNKCPICKGQISATDASGYIKCIGEDWSAPCFFAHVGKTGIDFWEAHLAHVGKTGIDFGLEEWEINSRRLFDDQDNMERCYTELRDRDDNLVLGLHEWYPYRTGTFLKDITKLLDRLLNLKAFL